MISSAPVAATADIQDVEAKVRAFLAIAKVKARDGISVAEFGELLVALMRVVIAAVDAFPIDGSRKKETVLAAVEALFDAVADKCIPTAAWPFWLLLRPAARQLVLMLASGAVESLLPLVRIAA
jgi:hypothetical protein